MRSKNIKVSLNNTSIKQAISYLKEYRSSIENKQAKLMEALGNRGYEVMVENIKSYPMPYSKGELIEGAGYESTSKTATIYNISDHALFVEFGTGIVGSRSPHPHDTIGYHYDVNNHGDSGWYYYSEDGSHWTKGMPSRPFAHLTYEELRQELNDIAREVFNDG